MHDLSNKSVKIQVKSPSFPSPFCLIVSSLSVLYQSVSHVGGSAIYSHGHQPALIGGGAKGAVYAAGRTAINYWLSEQYLLKSRFDLTLPR